MNSIIIIAIGLILFSVGVVGWFNERQVEKQITHTQTYFYDKEGMLTQICNGSDFFERYKIVMKEKMK